MPFYCLTALEVLHIAPSVFDLSIGFPSLSHLTRRTLYLLSECVPSLHIPHIITGPFENVFLAAVLEDGLIILTVLKPFETGRCGCFRSWCHSNQLPPSLVSQVERSRRP